jgi:hypothetical protein
VGPLPHGRGSVGLVVIAVQLTVPATAPFRSRDRKGVVIEVFIQALKVGPQMRMRGIFPHPSIRLSAFLSYDAESLVRNTISLTHLKSRG